MNYARIVIAALVIIVLLLSATTTWVNHESCLRSNSLRAAELISFQGTANRALERSQVDKGLALKIDLEAYQASLHSAKLVQPLNCSILVPDTK